MADTKYGSPEWKAQYDKWVNMKPDMEFSKIPRPLIQKLGLHITDRKFVKEIKTTDAEYYGLDPFVTDEMAEVALKMKIRKEYNIDDLVKLTGKAKEELLPILDQLCQIGLVHFETIDGVRYWSEPPFIIGSGEYFGMKKSMADEHVQATYLFDRMAFEPLKGLTELIPPGGAGMAMHVVPVEKAIEHERQSVDVEHLSYWLKMQKKFALMPCVCRMSHETIDEGSGEDYEDMCISCDMLADFVVETGRGHYATYEEVMEVIQKAEELGCVHQIVNLDGKYKTQAICNCNIATCNALRASQFFNTPNLSRSSFIAHVDKEKCVACGKCVEVCPGGAVKLGQKLCTLNGPIKYPQRELPDETKWGEERWNPNYRYDARTNCYDSGTAPCKTACPAHIAIQGYLKLAGEGKYDEALALIKQDNPFPAVCGRVCNRACEDACTRGDLDRAVSIDAVKKFIADLDLKAETRYIPPIHSMKRYGRFEGVKVGIIGAGPAGLSCAYYLAQMGYYPTVFEKNRKPGGMLRYGIPSYKLEKNVIDAEIAVLKEMGVEIRCNVEVGKDVTLDELRKEGYKGFYLAIGAQVGQSINIPGEDLPGVLKGVDFLHAIAEGKKPQVGKKVVVVGGGNVAIDVARSATRLGASDVTIVYRRTRDEMPAEDREVAEAQEEGVKFVFLTAPKEILAKDGKVSSLKVEIMELSEERDAKGRRKPIGTGEFKEIKANNVIAAIGQKVDLGGIAPENMLFNRNGTVQTAELTGQTAQSDIFAGGDVVTGPKFVINAIAAGREGAISLHRSMRPNTSLTLGRNRRDYIELDKENISIPIDKVKAPDRQEAAEKERVSHKTFRDYNGTLTEEQVKLETSRCLGCGASVVDPNKCIGCGLCTTRCKFDAIHLERDLPECSDLVPREEGMKKIIPYALKRMAKIKIKEMKSRK